MIRYILSLSVLVLFTLGTTVISTVSAQGVTGASFNGTVTDSDGDPLPGATVIARHEPSGTEYGTSTRVDGRFNLRNVRVGGPYTVRVTFIGFQSAEQEEIFLELGQDYTVNFELVDQAMELGEVAIFAQRDAIISGDRSGARSRVSREQLDALPSINRSIQDFTRLSPQVSGSNIAGRSGRRNAIQIDGVTFDDRFGLGSDAIPTIGNPISLDAIQEFQVEIAPFDVRQGNFTGGAINAVTRSGTNTFEGSAYYYGRNQNFISESLLGQDSPIEDFTEYQTGFRVGGPIVENELFFFVNAEIKRENSPLFNLAESNFGGDQSELEQIISITQNQYNYDPGGFGRLSEDIDDWKIFAKLDWNVSDNHRLTYQQNLVNGFSDRGISRGSSTFTLDSHQYRQRGNQSNFSVQLNSSWSDNMVSEAKIAYTRLRQEADFGDTRFPSVEIQTESNDIVRFGVERFRHANELDQDYLELTANVTYFSGAHTITFGTNNYLNQFRNLFIQDALGTYEFRNEFGETGIERFARGAPTRYQYSYSSDVNAFGTLPEANWGYNTFSLYVQDEWHATDNLTLTLGLRGDLTVFPDDPPSNQTFAQQFTGYDTGSVPDPAFQFNPRFGFNWNDGNTQIRGGAGLFSGGEPGVWLSNQYSNTGVDVLRVDSRQNFAGGFFTPDPDNQPLPGQAPGLQPIETTEVNITDPDFKINQIFRGNLAVEQRLPWNLIGSVEFIYSNNLYDIDYQNLNLPAANQNVQITDGRPYFGEVSFDEDGDAVFSQRRVSDDFTDILLLTNTNNGYQYSITAQLRKEFSEGWFGDISYTYADGKSVNDGTSSRAISNWQFNEVPGNPNNAPAARSIHVTPHRLLASASYRWDYGRHSTIFSVIYEGRQGNPLTYAYFNASGPYSINGDYRGANDLVYVPTSQDEILLQDGASWNELNNFIESNKALRENRGSIVPRGYGNQPWINQFDVRLTQQIRTTGTQTLELTFDVLNFSNMLGSVFGQDDWGVQRFASNAVVTEISFHGFDATELDNGDVELRPIVGFDESRVPTNLDQFTVSNMNSRWRAQIGVRYSF